MTQDENLMIKSKNCIVCILDILGYQDLVKKKSPEKVYKILLNLILKHFDNKKSSSAIIIRPDKIQIISDTLLFILDLEKLPDLPRPEVNHHKEQVWIIYFLSKIASISMDIMSDLGYLLRGGIAKGKYYQRSLNNEKNQFIFSKAFVDAHNLEKLADVPRVVISNDLHSYISEIKNGTSIETIKIARAVDGLYYLDIYHHKYSRSSAEDLKEILSGIVKGIKSQVEAGIGTKEKEKYYWFQNYRNQKLNDLLKHSKGRRHAKKYEKLNLKSLRIDVDSYLKNKPK